MVWEPADTVGFLSLLLGTLWIIIAPILSFVILMPRVYFQYFRDLFLIFMLIGGALFLTMGIAAVANDSKLGIGGIISGSIWVLIGITYFMIPRGLFY